MCQADACEKVHDIGAVTALLEKAGRKRGCLVGGGEVDMDRIAAVVLDEFRGGKFGRITLETPDDLAEAETDEG